MLLFDNGRTEQFSGGQVTFDINNLPPGCTLADPKLNASAPISPALLKESDMPRVFKQGSYTISCELVDIGESDKPRRLSTGAIVGAVLGGIAGLILLIAIPVAVYIHRRRRLVKRPSLKLQGQSV